MEVSIGMEATGGLITCRREAGKTGWKMGDVFHLLWCVCGGKGSGVPVCKRWRGRAPRPPRNTIRFRSRKTKLGEKNPYPRAPYIRCLIKN